ncbi:MAG: HAD hydrolase-like protein [Bacteroidia bacterium]|nr:HAD hydrolase-like protein [Bacteroidia bacterium]
MNDQPFTYRHIIWDWNGTLLDDKWLCIETINTLLADRNLPPINVEKYSKIFRFPVKEYYQDAGFDFIHEPFEVPAMEFIRIYNLRKKECRLQHGAVTVLELFAKMGCTQYLLSASETGILKEMTRHFGITHYFRKIKGLDNHYAHGKGDLGMELISSLHVPIESIVMIGDTCHDKEVADLLGIVSILCTNGHFPEERLVHCGARLIGNLYELASMISGI